MQELEEICKTYGIELRSVQSIKENLAPYELPFHSIHYEGLYRYRITTFDELNNLTTHNLHMICQQDYNDTMKIYHALMEKGISFQPWEDRYLFEVLSRKDAKTLSRRYRIYTIAQLRSCAEIFIGSMPPTIMPRIKTFLAEYTQRE